MKKQTKIFNNKFILRIVVSIVVSIVLLTTFFIGFSLIKNSKNLNNSKKEQNKSQNDALKKLQKLVDEDFVDENVDNNKVSDSISHLEFNLKEINAELNKSFSNKSGKKEANKTAINIRVVDTKNNTTKIISKSYINSEALDYSQNNNQNIQNEENSNPIIHTNKPKLVIIMDDMSFAIQVKKLKNLHLNITPSFFPPTYNHPYTAKYAKEFKHYMVHFPMQATNQYFHEEPKTLHIDSNFNFIENRVNFIKKNFPDVEFVNNHTGSKFTSNLRSMQKLYKALNEYNLIFIDSVTTSKSKAPIVARENHKILLQRDVFLDNLQTVTYIRNQLNLAVKISKKRGYAIAICHPHKATFEALKESKNILKGVQLIYIGEMYEFAKKHHLSRL